MINRTEVLNIQWGRNDRWPTREGRGFLFPPGVSKPVKGDNLISKGNRRAAMRAAKSLETLRSR